MPRIPLPLLEQARIETFHHGHALCIATRDHKFVAIYAITNPEKNHPYPVLGAILEDSGAVYLREWTLEGRYDEDLRGLDEDLVEQE